MERQIIQTESLKRIQRMRNGEKLKCPRCEDGYISALGNPQTTRVFKCDICGCGMSIRVPMKWTD